MNHSAEVTALLHQAQEQLDAGHTDAALERLDRALSIDPECSAALYEKGRIELSAGKIEPAQQLFARAASLEPERAIYIQYLGICCGLAGKPLEAEAHFRRVLALEPDSASAYSNLAGALKNQGRISAAVESFHSALDLAPDNAELWLNLGEALRQQGGFQAAIDAFNKALRIRPSFIRVNLPLAATLLDAGRSEEAHTLLEKLAGQYPNGAEIFDYLGQARMARGDFSAAIDSYQAAIRIKPGYARTYNNLGHALQAAQKPAEAVQSFRMALSLQPDYAKAHSNLLLTLNYLPEITPAALFTEAQLYGRQFDLDEPAAPRAEIRKPNRKIRIGYVSPDFRSHSVAHFTSRLLNAHDHERFEIYLYSAVTRPDQITDSFKAHAERWRPITHLSDQAAAEQIRQDKIDILVDLAGHTANNRLPVFGHKPAPVQVTWLGYPNTTGMQSINYRLTDAVADPPGVADTLHSEKLLRLESGFLCYQSDNPQPAVAPPPCLTNGAITFGSFNHLPKLNDDVVKLWARILQQLPDSRLRLKSRSLANDEVRTYCLELFAAAGVARERLFLHDMTPSRQAHLNLYAEVDIALDTFPYNGTTTTCEALWMGVPVITLTGERHAGRVGTSILTRTGCEEFIAANADEYVQRACALAEDHARLTELRQNLRGQMQASDLMNLPKFTLALENLLINIRQDSR